MTKVKKEHKFSDLKTAPGKPGSPEHEAYYEAKAIEKIANNPDSFKSIPKSQKAKVLKKGPKFQEKRGAAWKKFTKTGKKMLSFSVDDVYFSAFHNDAKINKQGKVNSGKEKSPDFFCYRYETKKDGSVWSIPVGGMYAGVYEKNGKENEIIRLILEQRFVLIPNPRKTEDNHPDYQIYLSYTSKAKGKAWNATGKAKCIKKADKKISNQAKLPLDKKKKVKAKK